MENVTSQEIGGPRETTTRLHGRAHIPLVRPFNAILDSIDLSWPKNDYIKDP
jgi:hypothetical protein